MLTQSPTSTVSMTESHPFPRAQVQAILERAATLGIRRATVLGPGQRIYLLFEPAAVAHVNRSIDGTPTTSLTLPIEVRDERVGVLLAEISPGVGVPPEEIMRVIVGQISTAWTATLDVESLSRELIHSYEELHLLYGLGETLTKQLSTAESGDIVGLILEKILDTIPSAWAELRLHGTGTTFRRLGEPCDLGEILNPDIYQLLEATLLSGGQNVGTLTLVRSRTSQPYSSADRMLLDAVSTLVANAAQSAQLVEKVANQTEALKTREAHLSAVLENVADGIITIDEHDVVQSFNPTAERIFGYRASEVVGKDCRNLIPEPSSLARRGSDSYLRPAATQLEGPQVRREVLGVRKNGVCFPIDLAVGAVPVGSCPIFVVSVRDVTDRKRMEDLLRHQASRDFLTDLPNRVFFQEQLKDVVLTARETNRSFAIFLLDLDHFKEINDTFGHPCGDRVLQEIASRLEESVREPDTIARLGGDEFAVLLPNSDGEAASRVAERLLIVLGQRCFTEGHVFSVGASIGIAIFPEHGDDGDVLLRRADIAMYEAKRAHSGYAFFSADLDAHSPERLRLRSELRLAIEREELDLHYQPLIDVQSQKIDFVEALARWNHPEHGLILPTQFIPIAEQTGVIGPLSSWVLNTALRQCHEWQAAGHQIGVAVNLSAENLQDILLPRRVIEALQRWDVPPNLLKVEITESCLLVDIGRVQKNIVELRAMGVKVGIDDFGTGFSSLSYLRELAVDEIKIDKSFVVRMAQDENDSAIVRSAINLGHDLGLTVVAEGVESELAWSHLTRLGCDVAQGFHLGKPMTATDFVRWLADRSAGEDDPSGLDP